MKRAAAVLVAVVVVSAAGIAYSAKTPSGFPNANTVFGGGHFVAFGVAGHNFSVTASGGTGTLVYSTDQIVAQITCLNVAGNVAVAAGVIVSTADGSNVGDPVTMYFEDNGQPSGTSVGGDAVSPIIIGSGAAPKTCPAANLGDAPEMDAVDAGDIAVHARGA